MKKMQRVISMLICTMLVAGEGAALPQRANAAFDDEWERVQEIIGQYSGEWTSPPTNVVTNNMTSGPILGNGDIGVVMGGDENEQIYYISKSDFWSTIKDDNSDGTPKAIGGISIKSASEGNKETAYSVCQDILNAEIVADMRFNGNPIHTKAWTAPNSNELVIEIMPIEANTDVSVQAELWSKSDNAENGYATSAGIENNAAWVTRSTPERDKGTGRAAVAGTVIGAENISVETDSVSSSTISFTIPAGQSVFVVTATDGGKDDTACLENAKERIANLDEIEINKLYEELKTWWKDYWLKEYVELNDRILEEYYYGSLYQMGAASREGKTAPGLFGHWTTTDSPAWGGDYTLDYNYYGPFNGMASSNRLEQLGSYFQPILDYMEEGKNNAQAVKSVNGKSYPNGLQGVKYPTHIGPWGMETYFDCGMKSHAAFAAIPFCWYYNYTQDIDFLRDTAYPYLIEVANFWDEFLQKDSSGRYVIYDSSARESWNGSNDVNPVIDIAFVRNLYKNIIPMSETLGVDEDRREKWQDILDNLSPLPTMEYNGKTVFKEAENRDEISTYGLGDNPVNMQGIFPGDNVGLDSDPELLETAINSLDVMNSWNQGNAFANIFVMGARVGWDAQDLMNKIKSRVSAIKQPNLTYQSDGHGLEGTGVIEAINSMLMQSHEGVIRFFPVWPKTKDAEFVRMRAVGSFLADARIESGVIKDITIYSESGKSCTVENPWEDRTLKVVSEGEEIEVTYDGNYYTFDTDIDGEYTLYPEEGYPDPVTAPSVEPISEKSVKPMPVPDIGWWKLNDSGETAVDSTDAENNGIIYGASEIDGKLKGARYFDGLDDYILIQNYIKPETFATYSAWVKADSLTTWGTILKNWGEWNKGQIQLGLENNTGCLSVHITQKNGEEVSCSEMSPFPTGTWQHVAVVADGSKIRLYRNGTETASTGYNGSLYTSFAPLGIGVKPNDAGTGAASASSSPGFWNGSIDDVRVYSSAFDAEEIGVLASFERYSAEYSEDFEKSSILNTIQGSRDGWSLGGEANERIVQYGNNLGINSNAVRFGSGNTWWNTMWMSLDIQENMRSRFIADGADHDIAAAETEKRMSGNVRLSFQVNFNWDDVDNSADESQPAEYVLKIKDAGYTPFAAIRVLPNKRNDSVLASKVTMSLIALDGSGTANKEYVILSGNDNINNKVMNVVMDINTENSTYKININGEDINTDFGVWIPASNTDSVGAAQKHILNTIPVKQLDFVLNRCGFYNMCTVDNIMLSKPETGRIIDGNITAAEIDEGVCNISSTIVNNSGEDITLKAIYALYNDDGVLLGTKMKDITLDGSGAETVQVEMECEDNLSMVKLFIWNGMENMIPLSNYIPKKDI